MGDEVNNKYQVYNPKGLNLGRLSWVINNGRTDAPLYLRGTDGALIPLKNIEVHRDEHSDMIDYVIIG